MFLRTQNVSISMIFMTGTLFHRKIGRRKFRHQKEICERVLKTSALVFQTKDFKIESFEVQFESSHETFKLYFSRI